MAFDFDDDDEDHEEQDLLFILPLQKGQMGTNQERQAIERLEDELEAAAQAAGVGEFDGDEYGGGECTLFFCGPDVEQLLAVLRPLVKRSPLGRGAAYVRMIDDGQGGLVQRRTML
ncbi:MAG: hypothetical protein JNN13_15670 [Planctomycetes bacterium]|nr:hypothetical protein [Planctomycetota bacterium]MBZ0154532.1 hypothetical protein [Planctomycetota bacterium]MCC7399577.1 hypothetical protein [Planctomycetota bacterium]